MKRYRQIAPVVISDFTVEEWHHPVHNHNHHELIYIKSGKGWHTIDGGPAGTVMTGALALLGYGVGALLLTVLVAHRGRRLTPSVLHPELVI